MLPNFFSVLRTAAALCCFALFTLPPNAAFALEEGEVGLVLSLKPGVQAEREGRQITLEQKSPVNASDILSTDATGRAQILFADDSSVSLGSNTSLVLEDVVAEGNNPVFRTRLGQGMARFITGKIVEQNPDAFSVVTPEATVGIRGTIFAVSTSDGKTTVYVMNTSRQVLVNGIEVPSGYKITLPDGTPLPMTPADLDLINDATLAQNSSSQNEDSPDNNLDLANDNTMFNPKTLEQPELGKQLIGDSMQAPATTNATITGGLIYPVLTGAPFGSSAGNGSFSFNVDLSSGAISSASMSNSHVLGSQPFSYTLSNGSGDINGNALYIDYPTATINGSPAENVMGMVNGTATPGGPSGLLVNGTYDVDFSDNATWGGLISHEAGTFTNIPH